MLKKNSDNSSQRRLKEEILFLKNELKNLNLLLYNIDEKITNLATTLSTFEQEFNKKSLRKSPKEDKNPPQTRNPPVSTSRQIISTDNYLSTDNMQFKSLIRHNSVFSTGNKGVSTDRQTHRQTDRQVKSSKNTLEKASEIIDSLDSIKEELKNKFKQLTDQEFLIFSTIYQLEEDTQRKNEVIDYRLLSSLIHISESSVRDHISSIIKKGIPVDKIKINNKKIALSLSKDLRKVASLSTILHIRES
jgi:hypothetical protein